MWEKWRLFGKFNPEKPKAVNGHALESGAVTTKPSGMATEKQPADLSEELKGKRQEILNKIVEMARKKYHELLRKEAWSYADYKKLKEHEREPLEPGDSAKDAGVVAALSAVYGSKENIPSEELKKADDLLDKELQELFGSEPAETDPNFAYIDPLSTKPQTKK